MKNHMDKILNPKAIAVVGASEVPGKAAERRTRSLIEGGYGGKIYLINPKRDELFGRKAYPSLQAVDGGIDLAMIVIPGRFIPDAVAQAGAKGAGGVIIITAGLGESGPEGKAIETQILDEAAKTGLRVIGPNCSGMFSAGAAVNLLGIPGIKPGKLSVLAQSGNIIDSLSHYAVMRGRGFSRIISSGNAIGVRFHEYIEFLAQDDQTEVIMLYLESIKQGDEIVRVCKRAARKKPVIALKVGQSSAGQRASASHTGALAVSDAIVQDAFRQAGIHRVNNADEMFDLAEAFLDNPIPKGRRVCILSEGGGDNSVAADNAERWGLEVPVLSQKTQDRLRPHLLAGMPAHNPIDYGGTAEENPDMIANCVAEVMADEAVDMVYLTGFFGGFKDIIAPHVGELETAAARRLIELKKQYQKPLMVHTSFAPMAYDSMLALREGGVSLQASSDRAAQCLGALARQARIASRQIEDEKPTGNKAPRDVALGLFTRAKQKERGSLLETEARELLTAYGIELPPASLAKDPEEARLLAEKLQYPLACKIVSPDIIHKSDCGGVMLNLADADQVGAAAERILVSAAQVTRPERIEGVLLSPMAAPGQEVIIGALRDASFGPVLMVGLGGVFVEVLEDVSFAVAPLSERDAERMLESIKGIKLLKGVRGESPKDLEAFKRLLLKLSEMIAENPEIAELDLNPVIVHASGLSVVDCRVILNSENG
jgi:acyl-CoA synthetase (NDP forming)